MRFASDRDRPIRETQIGQSVCCVDVGEAISGSRGSNTALAPGGSADSIPRSPSTVESLRIASAVRHAKIREFHVPGLGSFHTREICRSFQEDTDLWQTKMPQIVVNALLEYPEFCTSEAAAASRKKRTKLKLGKKK